MVLPCCLQLGIREYQQFLSFMCPGYQKTGMFPPLGTNPAMCPRPIFGTYDDHDSGWNNGNARYDRTVRRLDSARIQSTLKRLTPWQLPSQE